MRDLISVVVCEVAKGPYVSTMTFDQFRTLIGDTIEVIPTAALLVNGGNCPLPTSVVCLAGENARVRDNLPPQNRFGIFGTFAISGPRGHSLRVDRQSSIISLIEKYDAEAIFRSFQFPTQAMVAPAWVRGDREWSPEAHFTGDRCRADEIRFINYLLAKYADHIVAYFDSRPFPAMYSLQVQFAVSPIGGEQARAFIREYQNAFDANDRLRTIASEAAVSFFERRKAP